MQGLPAGLATVVQPMNLLFCFIGVFIGTLIGVLPGIGPIATISLLLPLTIGLDPVAAIIMIAGIYYGASYGGSTTAILVNTPGEAQSVVTCLDGYQMARQGRAGPALGIAAFGSFIAGTLGAAGIWLLSGPLMTFALRFGPPEYFTLLLLAMSILVFLTRGSMAKSLAMAILGLFLSQVGQDTETGEVRFTFGLLELTDGISIIPLAMGLFGVTEVLLNLESRGARSVSAVPITGLLPTRADWRESLFPILRGSVVGFFLGILPGGGATLASFTSYAMEKQLSRHPERFGRGAIAGVAGPEAANNAGAAGSFIPLLTLGLPSNAAMSLLLGALILYGVTPGPLLIQTNPTLFWGVVASMYVGNVMLLVLNLPLIGLWVQLLKVPYRILFPLILLFTLIGSYAVRQSVFDIYLLVGFGLLGYLLHKLDFDLAPLILAFVLGDTMEFSFRQALMLSHGSFETFFARPLAVTFLAAAALVLLSPLFSSIRRSRRVTSEAAS